MATSIRLSLKGFEELMEQLNKLEDEADDALKEALEEGIKPMVEDMKAFVPVDQGDLKDAIEQGQVKQEGLKQYIEAGLNFNDHPEAFYGIFVEFGHATVDGKRVDAQPFISTAYEKNKKESLKIMKNVIKRRLKLNEHK